MKFNPYYEDLQNPNKQNRGDLFDENGQLIMFQNLTNSETSAILYFKWMQIVDALPSKWRTVITVDPQISAAKCYLNTVCTPNRI